MYIIGTGYLYISRVSRISKVHPGCKGSLNIQGRKAASASRHTYLPRAIVSSQFLTLIATEPWLEFTSNVLGTPGSRSHSFVASPMKISPVVKGGECEEREEGGEERGRGR